MYTHIIHTYVYTCMHTYIHTYIYIHIHTYTYIYIQEGLQQDRREHGRSCRQMSGRGRRAERQLPMSASFLQRYKIEINHSKHFSLRSKSSILLLYVGNIVLTKSSIL